MWGGENASVNLFSVKCSELTDSKLCSWSYLKPLKFLYGAVSARHRFRVSMVGLFEKANHLLQYKLLLSCGLNLMAVWSPCQALCFFTIVLPKAQVVQLNLSPSSIYLQLYYTASLRYPLKFDLFFSLFDWSHWYSFINRYLLPSFTHFDFFYYTTMVNVLYGKNTRNFIPRLCYLQCTELVLFLEFLTQHSLIFRSL